MKQEMQSERIAAFKEFVADVRSAQFPKAEHVINAPETLMAAFLAALGDTAQE